MVRLQAPARAVPEEGCPIRQEGARGLRDDRQDSHKGPRFPKQEHGAGNGHVWPRDVNQPNFGSSPGATLRYPGALLCDGRGGGAFCKTAPCSKAQPSEALQGKGLWLEAVLGHAA